MNLNDFAREVHQNAVDHGFWEKRSDDDASEAIALIHSEWSEALEEYRASRPMVWYVCNEIEHVTHDDRDTCPQHGKKPEGIAVELIDGCIRILDLFGRFDCACSSETVEQLKQRIHKSNPNLTKDTPLPTLVCMLHSLTARAGDRTAVMTKKEVALAPLEAALGMVFFWISDSGLDPEALMIQKHEYNKTRPYKHGKRC